MLLLLLLSAGSCGFAQAHLLAAQSAPVGPAPRILPVRAVVVGTAPLARGLAARVLPSVPDVAAELRDHARERADRVVDRLAELLSPAAHAAEIEEQPEVPEPPGALKSFWNSIKDKPLIRGARDIISWIGAALRFLWAIPKALIEGDSEGLVDALGGLLARASAAENGGSPPTGKPLRNPSPPESAVGDSLQIP